MAATLLDLAVPGLGSGMSITVGLLEKIYSKYCQLKEGKELCINLHERLQAFIRELAKVDDQTREKEDLLSRLEALVKEYCRTVLKYLNEKNYVKRVMHATKFAEDIKLYNERLDSMIKLITVKQTVVLVEWRDQYARDAAAMVEQLTEMKCELLTAIRQIPEELRLLLKRDLDQAQAGQSHPLESILRNIANVTEGGNNNAKESPPSWLISVDECELYQPAIDLKGQSQVFVGKWQGVRVAIKKFRLVGENPVFDKHFKIWRSLLHPHVAQLYGAGSDEGAPFMVYEYAGRQSLDRCWDYLSQKDIWKMLHQAALGLSYLHARRIVHGNLCSSKLLVTDQKAVKLFGFGASYIRQYSESNSLKAKTRVEFCAPECTGIGADGNEDGINHSPTFRSDVYSFGLTIIEAITKQDPFQGLPLSDILDIKSSNRLHQPREMNDQAWDLVQQMCLCDPSKRVSLVYVREQLDCLAS
ncbi:hypothetical protein PC129_g20085 [Phytophthora cactorum]|uniref:Protein kinase domain-containing protein n=1 Tax=Phytophthora cactorum TaxID=29920 RepID=A0A329SUD5_9STRA|nr:hypothetical protein Pcac1_g13720 [Phytophthora cactorum]KAG2798711.1 hypothetical protein PC111_g20739 [Phytophthora cactorum]KAG2798720.1 hypothetical protein PC112_g21226 [Phytophthora cactorum]KAG2832093.1 hypothetical protein PC113_g20819 [Phytophthora cactorum]KAG2880631.1 hypothetical protein PC114_g21981 [Phytophthora cactorum]